MIIKVILDTRRANTEGKYPVKLSLANLGCSAKFKLDESSEWYRSL